MPTLDIHSQLLNRVYEQCKYLLVPAQIEDPANPGTMIDNPALIAPRDNLPTEAAIAEVLPTQNTDRIIRYIRAGHDSIENLKDIDALPTLMIEIGSGEFSLQRQNLGGDLPPRSNTPVTTVDAEPKRAIITLRIALTELPPQELYKAGGLEIDLEKSRPGRVFQIGDQLRQVLDPYYFQHTTQTLPQYSVRTEILETQERFSITDRVARLSKAMRRIRFSITDFMEARCVRCEAIYKQQVVRN